MSVRIKLKPFISIKFLKKEEKKNSWLIVYSSFAINHYIKALNLYLPKKRGK